MFPRQTPRKNPVMLRGRDKVAKYGTMVADAYLAAPDFVRSEAWRWLLLADHIRLMFDKIQRGKNSVRVVFVSGEPYSDAAQMKRLVAQTKTLLISNEHNTHPIFDPLTNLKFRAIHDYIVHIGRDTDFSMRGEILSYNAHAKIAPRDAVPALYTEVVGQAAVSATYGYFTTQKIALLPFDYYRVGIEA